MQKSQRQLFDPNATAFLSPSQPPFWHLYSVSSPPARQSAAPSLCPHPSSTVHPSCPFSSAQLPPPLTHQPLLAQRGPGLTLQLLCPRPAGLSRAEGAGPSAWPRLRLLTGQMDECGDEQTHHSGGGPESPSVSALHHEVWRQQHKGRWGRRLQKAITPCSPLLPTARVCTHARTYMPTHTLWKSMEHGRVHARALHSHTHVRTHTHEDALPSHVCKNTYTQVCACPHINTLTHTLVYTDLCTENTHAHACAHTRSIHTNTQKLRNFHKVRFCFRLPKNKETADGPWEIKMVRALHRSERLMAASKHAQMRGPHLVCLAVSTQPSAALAAHQSSRSEIQLQAMPMRLPDHRSRVILHGTVLCGEPSMLFPTLPQALHHTPECPCLPEAPGLALWVWETVSISVHSHKAAAWPRSTSCVSWISFGLLGRYWVYSPQRSEGRHSPLADLH